MSAARFPMFDADGEPSISGVTQISRAMTQVDHVTQKTASAAEELASTSEEMSAQAEALYELLARVGNADRGRRRPARGKGGHASFAGHEFSSPHLPIARSRRTDVDEFRPIETHDSHPPEKRF